MCSFRNVRLRLKNTRGICNIFSHNVTFNALSVECIQVGENVLSTRIFIFYVWCRNLWFSVFIETGSEKLKVYLIIVKVQIPLNNLDFEKNTTNLTFQIPLIPF